MNCLRAYNEGSVVMAMPQRDNAIEEIKRLDALLEYAVEHGDDAEAERLRREAEQRLSERKEQVAASLEPSTLIKSTIIQKQDELIGLLYQAETASPEMKALKAEIDREKDRLDDRPLSRIAAARRSE